MGGKEGWILRNDTWGVGVDKTSEIERVKLRRSKDKEVCDLLAASSLAQAALNVHVLLERPSCLLSSVVSEWPLSWLIHCRFDRGNSGENTPSRFNTLRDVESRDQASARRDFLISWATTSPRRSDRVLPHTTRHLSVITHAQCHDESRQRKKTNSQQDPYPGWMVTIVPITRGVSFNGCRRDSSRWVTSREWPLVRSAGSYFTEDWDECDDFEDWEEWDEFEEDDITASSMTVSWTKLVTWYRWIWLWHSQNSRHPLPLRDMTVLWGRCPHVAGCTSCEVGTSPQFNISICTFMCLTHN